MVVVGAGVSGLTTAICLAELHEQRLKPRVGQHHMLAEDRPQVAVASQLAGTQPGAVHHDRCRLPGLAQRAHGADLDLPTRRRQTFHEIVQVAWHVHQRHRGAETPPETLRHLRRLGLAQIRDQPRLRRQVIKPGQVTDGQRRGHPYP